MGLIPWRAGLRRVPAAVGTRCSSGRRLFKSSGCFLLIELDEVFDRKSIKRDGASRQLQSAEGSSAATAALYIIVRTQYGKWKETHLPSATTAAINTTSGHCCHSALNQESPLLTQNEGNSCADWHWGGLFPLWEGGEDHSSQTSKRISRKPEM